MRDVYGAPEFVSGQPSVRLQPALDLPAWGRPAITILRAGTSPPAGNSLPATTSPLAGSTRFTAPEGHLSVPTTSRQSPAKLRPNLYLVVVRPAA